MIVRWRRLWGGEMSYIRQPIYVYLDVCGGIFCCDDTETLHGERAFFPTKDEKEANIVAYKHMIEHVAAFYQQGRVDDAVTVLLAIVEDIEWRAAGGMKKAIADILEAEATQRPR